VELGDRVHAASDQAPQVLRRRHTARKAAADPHDRDRRPRRGPQLVEPAAGRAQVDGDPLEVVVMDEQLLLRAVEVYEIDRLDFADAYPVASAEVSGIRAVASFD
jgi:PIN domain